MTLDDLAAISGWKPLLNAGNGGRFRKALPEEADPNTFYFMAYRYVDAIHLAVVTDRLMNTELLMMWDLDLDLNA